LFFTLAGVDRGGDGRSAGAVLPAARPGAGLCGAGDAAVSAIPAAVAARLFDGGSVYSAGFPGVAAADRAAAAGFTGRAAAFLAALLVARLGSAGLPGGGN